MGCDSTSAFQGSGKKSAWEAWKAFPEATTAFIDLTNSEMLLKESPEFKIVERFVIILYHRTSMLDSVKDC